MTKIICFSDTHGLHRAEKLNVWFHNNPGDILLFAGDAQRNELDDGTDFIDWLHTLPYTHKVAIFGNHDFNSKNMSFQSDFYDDIKILNQNIVYVEGIKIFGSPFSPKYGNWCFMKEDFELKKLYQEIPQDTKILITHSPAFGILDKTCEGFNAGSKSLLEKIEDLRFLRYHICGHIHEAYGIEMMGIRDSINASVVDENYVLKNLPVVVDYKR